MSDRLIISYCLGLGMNGIYTVANKIPALYTTIFNVYNIAWVEAVSRGVGDDNQKKFVNEMFERSIRVFGAVCALIISSISIIFPWVIGKDYSGAFNHIFILMIAIFINSLCALYGGIFTAYKKSKTIGFTTVFGGIVNIIVNVCLVRYIGLYAASFSTLVSYLFILFIRILLAKKIINIKWPYIYIIQLSVISLMCGFAYFNKNLIIKCILLFVVVIWSIVSNKRIILTVLNVIKTKIKKQ